MKEFELTRFARRWVVPPCTHNVVSLLIVFPGFLDLVYIRNTLFREKGWDDILTDCLIYL